MPVSSSPLLPVAENFKPPLLREHRLYQADWLLRYYHFRAEEILDEDQPDLDPRMDPKCCWALRHLEFFPVEVNRADYESLLRVPGLGVRSARRILRARRVGPLNFEGLKRLGVVLKRAQYFLTCSGRMMAGPGCPGGPRPGRTHAGAAVAVRGCGVGACSVLLWDPPPSAGHFSLARPGGRAPHHT